MLSGILKKEDCASCRFCCSFRRTSLWETPIFTEENITAIEADNRLNSEVLNIVKKDGFKFASYNLGNDYKTQDPFEEVPCPYLGENGCTLSSEEKPWDCKIWPLRVMKKDQEPVIALTPTCPTINSLSIETVRQYVNDDLRNDILEYAKDHPYLIKKYRPDYPVI